MRKLKLDLHEIVVHTFDTRAAFSTSGVPTLDSCDVACSGVYCSLAQPCEDVGAAPTPNGITCDNA
jgi:hypothetical protein